MKIALILLVGISACLATPTPVQQGGNYQWGNHQYEKIADKDWLARQKNILLLYKYVNQPDYYKQHYETAKTFNLEQHVDSFTNSEAVHHFLDFYKHDILPRNTIFSVFYWEHLKQAIALYKVFYHAKDWDTFYNTAVWARNYVNQGIWLYAFTVAVLHRPDTYGIVVPPIYEVYPYYFYNTEVINKAQYYKQVYTHNTPPPTGSFNGYTVNANYSGWYLNLHPEQSLSYFTEDVGINAFYYYYNLYHPHWLDTKEYPVNTYQGGEEFYYFHQQLLARYYLERLSNDFGEIESIDWQQTFETGYFPTLEYPNGLSFPQRPNHANFHHNHYTHGQTFSWKESYGYSHFLTQEYEKRIVAAIDSGFVITKSGEKINIYTEDGFNTLGNLIEGNTDSVNKRFYGHVQVFARHLLSYTPQPLHPYKVAPSALHHFETSLRDPAFYHFYKNIILYFQTYKNFVPQYNYTNLVFDGVKVQSVQVDPLITYFDKFDSDIENAVWVNENEFEQSNFHVRVRQHRLNHKPFTYKINVVSEKPVQASVRVFIGPKYDEYGRVIPIHENYINFVQFDQFVYNLQAGQNALQRDSHDLHYAGDYPSFHQLNQQVEGALSGNGEFHVYGTEQQFTFPNRFLLPKGKQGGQTFQFYVIVTPYTPTHHHQPHAGHKFSQHPIVGLGVQHYDDYPLGYPFDRPIQHEHEFHVPNSHFHDVVVFHKSVETINTVQN